MPIRRLSGFYAIADGNINALKIKTRDVLIGCWAFLFFFVVAFNFLKPMHSCCRSATKQGQELVMSPVEAEAS